MKLVLVEWVDARFANMWQCKDENLDVIKCTSIGLLKRETKTMIEVCLHINDEMKAGCMAIPKVCITRMRTLKVREG